jgi:16S rRNA (cytosine1402-N4)-methyltransferase
MAEVAVTYHKPALLAESLEGLAIRPDGVYVDVTFGGGGHSSAILDRLSTGTLYAFDQDADAQVNLSADDRLVFIPRNFRHLKQELHQRGVSHIDGLLADLGVSSHQFDTAGRGFSIRHNAELDMRMDTSSGITAADVLERYEERDLALIFRNYGELPAASRIAARIVHERQVLPVNTVARLKEVTSGFAPRGKENSFYAQLFQALRIEVNDELQALRELLEQAAGLLQSGGRLVVISYHSLEDRLVKNFIQTGNFEGELHKDFYGHPTGIVFNAINRKPIEADPAEVNDNPRARSAKLRIAEKR